MNKRRYLTAAEAAVLDAALPVGMREEMREMAYYLFEALALDDERAGAAAPSHGWMQKLQEMARMAIKQMQHLAREKGGRAIYLAKGVTMFLSERDREMCAKFRGDYDALAEEYGLTPMRVRQIVGAWQQEQFLLRQGRLPGLDSDPEEG